MITIGEFAAHGRVSVRMLRHYDALGLLRPARTEPSTGYRYYAAAQLARLNRVIALKDLGFTLQQVRSILDEEIGPEELRGMLRLRRAELAEEVASSAARLDQVEARLRTIESEGRMPSEDIVVKSLPEVRVAELSGIAASYGPQDIGPVIGPLFDELCQGLAAAGVVSAGPAIARYEDATEGGGGAEGGGAIRVRAAIPVGAGVSEATARAHGFTLTVLPAVPEAATVVHRGPMAKVLASAQLLAGWIDASGRRAAGYTRELSLECPEDPEEWVTELQQPLRAPETP